MTLGITVPLGQSLHEHADLLRALYDGGYTDFWSSETAELDAFTPLAYAAAVLPEARFGTAIASVFTRGPALLAMSAAAVAETAPGRFTLGIGASSPAIAQRWNSVPYEKPYSRVRDTLRFLRPALAGERIDESYDTFQVKGFRLERPVSPSLPIVVGALRERMLGLAGAEGDGAVLNWLSASDVAKAAPVVGAGKQLVARIFVCVSENADLVRSVAKRLITGYLTVPAYADFQRWLGRGDALSPMWTAWASGDRKAALAAVPDHVVDELVVHGSAEECAAHVRRYADAGITTPVLKFLPLDPSRDLAKDVLAVAAAY
ncbi:LLM class F420-dependent oxidoreductase [Allokutzneria multivorans]|uniref:LLM class F420-dependent oxidoreductase n=1 Tax=Allokutzneria multivorans TaxID=1142134 RepID=A0ABP7SBE3_9PSEU